jgi:PAS domain S-box-containing protein
VALRDRFEMLFEHCVDGVFFMALDEPIAWHGEADKEALLDYTFEHLRLTSINRVFCEQTGAPREQLIGTVPRDRWTVDIDVWRARIRELYDHGRTYFTMRAPRSDGRWLDVEGQYVCTYDEQGRITGCFGTQRDITEKVTVAARLDLAMIAGDIGIWELDLKRMSLFFDDRWTERMGYARDAPEVRSAEWWSTCVHPADMAEAQRQMEEHVLGNTPLYRSEHRMRTARGDWMWVLSRGRVAARDDDGVPQRIVGVCVDITERKLLQERLFLAERMASLGTLAAGVGHEINNPLTYIVLNLTLLERELRNLDLPSGTHGRVQSMVEQARYGADRVGGIVRDLQALTRVPDERITRVDAAAVLERCLEIADHQIRHRARVIRELENVPAVCGSEGRMVQLFLNLLVNAAQAIPDGSIDTNWIRVRTSVENGRVAVAISDTGVGIGKDALARIFDPFYTTKRVGEGTGLGLSICRSIVTALGGEIQVESAVGRGTTFRVLLPPAAEGDALPEGRASVPAPPKKRVLVIDDEPMVGQLVGKVLSGHDVVAETSAREALSRLHTDPRFDVILCDVMMPDVSGIDFYDQLGPIDPTLRNRVVFLSGGAFTERAQAFLDRVPNRRLSKPFDVDALMAVLLSPGDHDALP